MNVNEFLNGLENISSSYRWDLEGGKVTARIKSGPNRGLTLNPITAIAHKAGFGFIKNTREGTELAGSLIGLTRRQTRNLYSAILGTYNRGNTQVVRGKIRSALEV